MSAQEHLGDFPELLAARAAARRELERELFQTRNRATIDAHEVRMAKFVASRRFAIFEAANLVTQIQLGEQARRSQFLKNPIDRRLIEPEFAQGIDNFAVTHRFAVVGQMLEHSDPGGGTPQASTFKNRLSPGGIVLNFGRQHSTRKKLENQLISSFSHLQVNCK